MSDGAKRPVDAVVVGMGLAGTIVAKELSEAGLRVVGLERGRMVDPRWEFAMPGAQDELRFGTDTDLMQDLGRETITFRNTPGEIALPMREIGSFMPGECVGGAAVRWGAGSTRLLPWDFESRSRTIERYGAARVPVDATTGDWGIGYDDLEPYYDMFECVYGIGGRAGNIGGEIQPGGNPFEGARTRAFPNPPPEPSAAGAFFTEVATSMGLSPFPQPTAAMTRPYTNPYRLRLGECVRSGFCARHGCPRDAKATPLTAVLPALLRHENFELRTGADVLRIDRDSTGRRATGVTHVDGRGRECRQAADLVILAAYAFNNTRLMLLSGIGRPYDPRTGRGVVGRAYSYQATGHVRAFFDDRSFNRFIGGGGHGMVVDDFAGDNFDHSDLDFIGGAKLTVMSTGAPPIRSHVVPDGTPRWGSGWKAAVAHWYDRVVEISVEGGCQSHRLNYLDLDPTYRDALGRPLLRMTFDWHENEHRSMSHGLDRAEEIARAMAPTAIARRPLSAHYDIVSYQSTHNAGGVPMGADPETSAVNRHLQSWDVDNLFVIGASAFPQTPANNPSATVGALAYRTAGEIRERWLARPGPLG